MDPYPVGPGWWPLLDEVSAQVKELDPEIYLSYKEKYGTCQIDFVTESTEHFNEIIKLTADAEEASKTICEVCGQPGEIRTQNRWLTALCDRCASLNPSERWKVASEAEQRYHLDMEQAAMDSVANRSDKDYTV